MLDLGYTSLEKRFEDIKKDPATSRETYFKLEQDFANVIKVYTGKVRVRDFKQCKDNSKEGMLLQRVEELTEAQRVTRQEHLELEEELLSCFKRLNIAAQARNRKTHREI